MFEKDLMHEKYIFKEKHVIEETLGERNVNKDLMLRIYFKFDRKTKS